MGGLRRPTLLGFSAFMLAASMGPAAAHGMGGKPEWDAAGEPGKPDHVSRTVAVKAADMRYSLRKLDVSVGETVRIVITNNGPSKHEFVIGTRAFHAHHIKEMGAMPDMEMNEANSAEPEPGQTGTLIWHFTRPGDFVFGCDIPGHFQAGMSGSLRVR